DIFQFDINNSIKYKYCRFSVNLLSKASGNIALHFNVRLDRGYVVRNTKFKGCWEEEETCSPAGHTAFRRNSYTHILIFCTANEFQVRTKNYSSLL
ncbi:Galectin-9, partial [Habropoda laboriosa]